MKWLSLFLVALCPAVLAAQSRDSTAYPPRREYRHHFRLVAPYDPDQDKTILQLGPLPLDSTLAVTLLSALDAHGDSAPAKSVVMTFWSTGPKDQFKANHHVWLRVDADSIDLGQAWEEPNPRAGYTEILLKGIRIPALLRLVHGGHATLTLGPRTYTLTPEELEGLRDFASRLTPRGSP